MNDNSNQDKLKDNDYPGYPHYPASEDITHPANSNRKVAIDDEIPGSGKGNEPDPAVVTPEETNDLPNSDGNDDYVQGAQPEQLDNDGTQLNEAGASLENPGADLDVPGNEDDASGAEGFADEENNYYSLGGDNHEDLEEDINY